MLLQYLENFFEDIELKDIFNHIIDEIELTTLILAIESVIMQFLNAKISQVLFLQVSIGAVFGFRLSNNTNIVLKMYSPKISYDYLIKMNEIQSIFNAENFPAPNVLSPIVQIGHNYAGLYSMVYGKKADAHHPIIRNALATHLARFSDIVDQYYFYPLENFYQLAGKGRLWPVPHNPLFDLQKTTRGAGWIAQKARSAKRILATDKSIKKLAHTDWGTKNAIFENNQLKGVFDWDSLGTMSEPEMVGRAAAQFTADWESEFKITPTPEEGREFVAYYEKARQKSFTPEEYKIISASADYLIATISRFEYAGNNPLLHPYQDLLRECGDDSFLFV